VVSQKEGKNAMHCAILTIMLTATLMFRALPTRAGEYGATNENGVRVFSNVPPVGVHPRVLMSPEDLPAWRKEVIKTYRGKTFFAKRFESKRIDTQAAFAKVRP
jgi:hypothetical protein